MSGDALRTEIERLHRFFQDWFTGALPESDEAFATFERALAPDFELVSPDGRRTGRAALVAGLRAAWGSRREVPGFAIRVERVRPRRTVGDLQLATYEEWHDAAAGSVGRSSLAVFERRPEGLCWVQVHEVALSDDGPAADAPGAEDG